MPRLLVVISALAQLHSTVAFALLTRPTLPLAKPKSVHVDVRMTEPSSEFFQAGVLPSVAAQLGCTSLVVATTIEPRAAMCAAADAENNDARINQHTRETLPLVTPGLYLDAPNDSELRFCYDALDISRLPAELQKAAGRTEDAAPSLIRVCCGCGWVVHGLVLEYSNGLRTGFFLENDGSPVSLWDDAAMQRRNGVWHEIFPGEQLVSISGCNSILRPTSYLCGMVVLLLSSGRTIMCMGAHPGVFGTPFMHAAPGGGVLATPPSLSMAAAPACGPGEGAGLISRP